MSRGKYIGKGEAAKGEMLADYESHNYPEETSQLHDLTANHSTARVVLRLGVVTVALPGRRSLAWTSWATKRCSFSLQVLAFIVLLAL